MGVLQAFVLVVALAGAQAGFIGGHGLAFGRAPALVASAPLIQAPAPLTVIPTSPIRVFPGAPAIAPIAQIQHSRLIPVAPAPPVFQHQAIRFVAAPAPIPAAPVVQAAPGPAHVVGGLRVSPPISPLVLPSPAQVPVAVQSFPIQPIQPVQVQSIQPVQVQSFQPIQVPAVQLQSFQQISAAPAFEAAPQAFIAPNQAPIVTGGYA